MGTDIHEAWEHQDADGNWSIIDNVPPFWRAYSLFGILAGVRGECPVPIQRDRGLPDGTTVTDYNPEWHHSPGWVGLDEIVARANTECGMCAPWMATTPSGSGACSTSTRDPARPAQGR